MYSCYGRTEYMSLPGLSDPRMSNGEDLAVPNIDTRIACLTGAYICWEDLSLDAQKGRVRALRGRMAVGTSKASLLGIAVSVSSLRGLPGGPGLSR